jgi:hypothetical protein
MQTRQRSSASVYLRVPRVSFAAFSLPYGATLGLLGLGYWGLGCGLSFGLSYFGACRRCLFERRIRLNSERF